jgi:hypothetical protein
MLPPAQPITVATRTTDLQLVTGAGIIVGWSFVEPTNSAGCAFELYDNTSAAGALITSITLVTNESTRDLIGQSGLLFEMGVFLHPLSGSVKGSLWVIAAQHYGPAIVDYLRAPRWY